MNRPEVHNAFDETLIAELTAAFAALDADRRVRAIVLAGEGKSFSAGADLNWMKRQGAAPLEDEPRRRAQARGPVPHDLVVPHADAGARARRGARRRHGAGFRLRHLRRLDAGAVRDLRGAARASSRRRSAPTCVRAIGERQAYRYFQTAERISGRARPRDRPRARGRRARGTGREACSEIVDALLAGGPHGPGGCHRPDPRGGEPAGRRCRRRGHGASHRHAARDDRRLPKA